MRGAERTGLEICLPETLRDERDWTLSELLDRDWAHNHVSGGSAVPPRTLLANFDPRFVHVFILRVAQRLYARRWYRLAKLFSTLNIVLFGLEVPARLRIGPGLVIPHPYGTIIGAGAVGENVIIFQQVTLGAKFMDHGYNPANRPQVGDNVVITAGAKIAGPIRIGDGSVIGANAVVLADVPPDCLAVGVPAKIKPLDADSLVRRWSFSERARPETQ